MSTPLRGEMPAISALERKDEPWSSYTEGWNDALDLAERAAARELSKLEDEYRRLLWIIAHRSGGRVLIPDSDLVIVPSLPGVVVIKDPAARTTEIVADTTHLEHVHSWVTDGVAPGKKLCIVCRLRTFQDESSAEKKREAGQ